MIRPARFHIVGAHTAQILCIYPFQSLRAPAGSKKLRGAKNCGEQRTAGSKKLQGNYFTFIILSAIVFFCYSCYYVYIYH